MKNKINILKSFLLLACITTMAILTGCKDYTGEYEMTDGVPTINYVRLTDPTKADSLLVSAFMGQTICLVGDNLTSIHEVYFNDIKATLNINYITKNTLIVTVPNIVPGEKTDKIYMTLKSGKTVDYDFKVGIPAPIISRIKCDHVPAGGTIILLGDYFFDYEDGAIGISIGSYTVPHDDILSVEKTRVSFVAPADDVKGNINVKTIYGRNIPSYKSLFRDMSGLITSFEDSENGGTGFVGGWGRPAASQFEEDPQYAITGKYLKWSGDLKGGEWSAGPILNIWSQDNSDINDPMFTTDPKMSALKFEINVLEKWNGLPMIFCFDAANTNEAYLWADTSQPRAFYAPWVGTESGYVSEDGWETVTIPLTDMVYAGNGSTLEMPTKFGELGIALHNRGAAIYAGSDSSPVILIDNVRVVSTE